MQNASKVKVADCDLWSQFALTVCELYVPMQESPQNRQPRLAASRIQVGYFK